MTATIHDLSLARRVKIIREAKDAMRNGLVHLDPMAAWYSAEFPLGTTWTPQLVERFIAGPPDLIELPCDTEPK